MKTSFQSQQQVAHIWAQQNHESGKCNGALYFEGATIYSYGSHFPCATFIDDETVLVNSDSYSVSTSKQQGYVRQAINHKKRIYASTAVIKAFLWDRSFNDQAQRAAIRECTLSVENHIFRAKQKKAQRYKANDINNAQNAVNTCKALFDNFAAAYPDDLLKLESLVSTDDYEAIVKADGERRAALAQAEKERQEKREKDCIAEIKKYWVKGKPMKEYSPYNCSKVFMRISGDDIETSKGARFPIAHAKKAFKFIRGIKERKVPEAWVKNGKTIHLGHFEIDMIASDGTVKAGCHTVEWSEIKRIAALLGIYP